MSTRIVLIIVIIVVLVVGALVFERSAVEQPTENTMTGEEDNTMHDDDATMEEKEGEGAMMEEKDSSVTITYTDSGYSPANVTIAAGTTVIFTNESSGINWPASAFHPTHTVYPDSNITKCGTSEADQIFDACASLSVGETYSFTFNEVGEWGFHNHLRASHFGKITVE